ncbi:hypothetical protein [Bacillus cihuensis]|uniref:hypothetical protein n=1 Tax=Bacillus cihuensis TaxID=1208599 RepID=UPI0004232467|nr:hypothetical protein [Bacillus cihuensis]
MNELIKTCVGCGSEYMTYNDDSLFCTPTCKENHSIFNDAEAVEAKEKSEV